MADAGPSAAADGPPPLPGEAPPLPPDAAGAPLAGAAAAEAAAAQPPPPAPDDGAGPASASEAPLPAEDEEEEDPLVVAQREREAAERAKQAAPEIPPYDEDALKVGAAGEVPARGCQLASLYQFLAAGPGTSCRLPGSACSGGREHHSALLSCPAPRPRQEFYTDLKDAEREGEVNRILSAFKLNPFEQMNLHNDATPEEVRRQYRKVRTAWD